MLGGRLNRGLRRSWPLLALALAAAVTACGGNDGSASTGATGGSPATSAPPKTIKIVLNAPMAQLDPDKVNSIQDIFVWNLIAGTLTKYSAGSDAGQPELAQSFTESADQRTWTAKLRPGLKFSDGTPLTARDAAATFQRILSDKAAFQRGFIPTVTGVDAKGADTVVFHLSAPSATLPVAISQPQFAILPAAGIKQGKSFFAHPISAGRYALDSFSASDTRLKRNDDYYGTHPGTTGVELTVTPDDGARLAQVKRGDANFAWQLPAALIPQINGNSHVQVVKEPGSIEMILNLTRPPLDNVRVRQAINLAVDRQAINQSVWAGKSTPTAEYWPSLFPYFVKGQTTTPDVAAAKAQLQGTPCAGGCAIKMLTFSNLPWTQTTALILQQNLKKIGIDLQLDPADEATAAARGQKGDFDVDLGPLTGLVVLPESLTPTNLQPSGPFKGGLSRYKSSEMDALVEQLLKAPLDQRAPIAKQVGDLYAKDRPFVNLVDFGYVNASNLPDDVLRQELFGFVIK